MEKGLSLLLTIAALTLVGVELKREFWPTTVTPADRRSFHIDDWRAMLPAANVVGSRSAPVTVAVFTDFQCPFCKRFDAALTSALAKYPTQIATAIVHMPLPGHEAAVDAANASECASEQGRFQQAIGLFYQKQDSLGKLPWTRLVGEVGVGDTVRFLACMRDTLATRRVGLGQAEASKRGFKSTPTVIVNGWRYGVPPSDTELVRAIGDILEGKKPYRGFNKADLASLRQRVGLR